MSFSTIHASLFSVFALSLAACGARVAAIDNGDGAARDAATDAVVAPDAAPPTPLRCEPGQWCWQSPLPQGNALHAVFTVSASEAWAVGARGTIVHYANGQWTPVRSPTDFDLRQLWGASASEVWAIGDSGERTMPRRDVLLRWNGAQWSEVAFGSDPTVISVDGSGPDNIWLVTSRSSGASLQRWNGGAFVAAPALPDDARAQSLCVRSATEVWVTAGNARGSFPTMLYRWDGAAWTLAHRAEDGSGERFNSPVFCPADGVAIAGYFDFNSGQETYLEVRNGMVGGDRPALPRATGPRLTRTPHGEVFYSNSNEAVQWTPMGWRRSFAIPNVSVYSANFDRLLDGSAGWFASATPFVSSWVEGAWRADPATITQALRLFVAPVGINATDPIAAFGDRVWARRDGARWVYAETPTIANGMLLSVNDAWGADTNRMWLVGEAGAIALYNASAQSITAATVEDIGTGAMRDIDGLDANNVWAVGDGATVRRLVGDRWAAPSVALPRVVDGLTLSDLNLTAVDVRAADDVMILGNDIAGGRFASVFFRWNGTTWTASMSFGVTLQRFDRDTRGDVYTVEGSTVKKRPAAGGAWVEIGDVTGSVQRLRVWGPDEIELVQSSREGAGLYRWDMDRRAFTVDGAIVPVDGITNVVTGIDIAGAGSSFWAAGAFGAVLRYEPRR